MFPHPADQANYQYPQDGTTVGYTNGLESFVCIYNKYGIKKTSIEIAVLPYNKTHGKFSGAGDSGSIALTGDGHIVGILTGGAGPSTSETNITYLTPYWWVEQQIKAKLSSSYATELCLYPYIIYKIVVLVF
ncbi:hypothetical protein BC827DRAFT_1369679 [Russula dissimulans]|nr:hypothetical protein BC827DRAFT_1369679 [Russula dissimulans]